MVILWSLQLQQLSFYTAKHFLESASNENEGELSLFVNELCCYFFSVPGMIIFAL